MNEVYVQPPHYVKSNVNTLFLNHDHVFDKLPNGPRLILARGTFSNDRALEELIRNHESLPIRLGKTLKEQDGCVTVLLNIIPSTQAFFDELWKLTEYTPPRLECLTIRPEEQSCLGDKKHRKIIDNTAKNLFRRMWFAHELYISVDGQQHQYSFKK